ncbi:uncharacterized mitochondrial protein AtMg00810-like [Mercurialis annua]|uniref:uncharacterized mitochondrial protein AtMg00810-like n=1 Tax=Mercurialis annua TaxID=3986 RepID=UPI00215F00C2|nr:uncharacterized mitochondrial protein AtMg00810-like [Mercurialis annua]
MVMLLVYVDIIITGTDIALIKDLQHMLHSTFKMKDLGHLNYFLCLEVHPHQNGLLLNQNKYAQDLIDLAALKDVTPDDTPMEVNVKFQKDEGNLLPDPFLYRRLFKISRFMQSPQHLHLATVRRIIIYIFGSPSRGLFFPVGSSLHLTAYSDADWAGCPDTKKSTTGWCMFIGNALISWKCKKQDCVSKSSTKLHDLLSELGFTQVAPTPLHADNPSAIQITANPVHHERTKYIEIDCHYIWGAFDRNVITLPHISTALQVADVFTKATPHQRHKFLTSKLMLFDLPASI